MLVITLAVVVVIGVIVLLVLVCGQRHKPPEGKFLFFLILFLVRKDMDVREHDSRSSITLRHKLK
jgi:hypothetical protein